MPRCLIALGGNLGASESMFEAAMHTLEQPAISLIRISRVFRTRPVGASAGNEFLNAAATIECGLEPNELLSALHEVELDFGRTRTQHWGPRTLDLDLLLFDQHVLDRPDIVVPHPAMWYRRFVLDPAADVAPEMMHPILMQTVSELQRALRTRPIRLRVFPGDGRSSQLLDLKRILHRLAVNAGDVEWVLSNDSSRDPVGFFAGVVIFGRSSEMPHRTQPENADSRLVTIHADTDDSAVDQLTQLSAAILG